MQKPQKYQDRAPVQNDNRNRKEVLWIASCRGYDNHVRRAFFLVWVSGIGILPVAAQTSKATSLIVNVAPQCAVTLVSLSPGISGPPGQTARQTLNFTYKVRTAASGGHGQIVLSFTSGSKDFPNGSKVDYQTTLSGPGTPASGSVSTPNAVSSGIVVATFGTQASSNKSGATGTIVYTVNPPPSSSFGPLTPGLSIGCQ